MVMDAAGETWGGGDWAAGTRSLVGLVKGGSSSFLLWLLNKAVQDSCSVARTSCALASRQCLISHQAGHALRFVFFAVGPPAPANSLTLDPLCPDTYHPRPVPLPTLTGLLISIYTCLPVHSHTHYLRPHPHPRPRPRPLVSSTRNPPTLTSLDFCCRPPLSRPPPRRHHCPLQIQRVPTPAGP
jgi:hypothetical protein